MTARQFASHVFAHALAHGASMDDAEAAARTAYQNMINLRRDAS